MAEHNDLGKKGEEAAVNLLKQKGYEIIEQNWTYEKYEIDIIARNEELYKLNKFTLRQSKWVLPLLPMAKILIFFYPRASNINKTGIFKRIRIHIVHYSVCKRS